MRSDTYPERVSDIDESPSPAPDVPRAQLGSFGYSGGIVMRPTRRPASVPFSRPPASVSTSFRRMGESTADRSLSESKNSRLWVVRERTRSKGAVSVELSRATVSGPAVRDDGKPIGRGRGKLRSARSSPRTPLKAYDKILAVRDRETKAMVATARSLRITRASQRRSEAAGRAESANRAGFPPDPGKYRGTDNR